LSYINDLYIFVEDEEVARSVTASEHPVEQGVDITDHIKPDPAELSITGKIVGETAADTLRKVNQLMRDGSTVNYTGRNIFKNMIITSFNHSHPNTVWGGCNFDMTLKEIKVADPSYRTEARLSSGIQQVNVRKSAVSATQKIYHTTKKGDSVYALVTANTAPYKKYGFTANDVMKNNPKAFSKSGDFASLIIGTKIWVGNR